MKRIHRFSVLVVALACGAGGYATPGARAGSAFAPPRILALPWMVIDRTSNKDRTLLESGPGHVRTDADQLAQSAQAALDGVMHRYALAEMIPRREWEPYWKKLRGRHLLVMGSGCAVCSPPGQLLRFDREGVVGLARAVRADYVWLGLTVVPLTQGKPTLTSEECCRDALAMDRENVLARSSALLVRARDGEVVWQRDARWPDPAARRHPRRIVGASPGGAAGDADSWSDREKAVDATARALANAFRRDHAQILH